MKIKSKVADDEIYEEFGKIYRRYKILYRKSVGDYFFKETESLLDKFCNDFIEEVNNNN